MKRGRRIAYGAAALVVAIAVVAGAAACGSSSNATTPANAGGSGASGALVGAGSTFAQPLYSAWAQDYQGVSGVQLNYQAIGSGGGIAQIEAKTVGFGATDAPLTAADLQTQGLVQFPTAVGGTVPIINVKGIPMGKLRLDGPTLADIFLGKITMWNDPAIKALNPGLNLPAEKISVVHRSDSSGTSWIFTSYLSAVSPAWKSAIGANTAPAWPVGTGGAKSAGVAALVQQVNGSIGYVEYAYAKENSINYAQMKSADGTFVSPTLASFAAAAKNATWDAAQGFGTAIVNQPGADSWPITGATFALVQKAQPDAQKAQAVLKFFDWGYRSGASMAQSLDYVPMPAKVWKAVEKVWQTDIIASGTSVWPAK